MNDTLNYYLYEEIVPRYADFDMAHRQDHALIVMEQAMRLLDSRDAWLEARPDADPSWRVPVDRGMLLTAAACHDLGLVNGRENHHMDSGSIIRSDARLREWFDPSQIEMIAQAAEDHRASGKSAPRSIYGMIVAEADRVIDGDTIIRRTLQFGFRNYPGLDRMAHICRAIGHLKEKYGRGGYMKLWIPWSDNAARLSILQDTIASDDDILATVSRIYDELESAELA